MPAVDLRQSRRQPERRLIRRDSGDRPRRWPIGRSALVVALLALLVLGVGFAAAMVGWLNSRGPQQTTTVLDRPTSAGAHHSSDDPALTDLDAILAAQGTGAALQRLEELAAADATVRQRAHHYVHEVGQRSYHRYGSLTEAFHRCGESTDSGCYHGVLQAYFADLPAFTEEEVADFCGGGAIAATTTWILEFQCLHGLGHGLAVFFNHRVLPPLTYCDHLRSEDERDSCYGGVFMENIVFAETGGGDAPTAASAVAVDPRYPCTTVGEQYKRACYIEQAKAILLANDHNFGEAFAECEQAPPRYVVACYQGVGAGISTFTIWDADRTAEQCMLGNDPYRIWCFAGAIKVLLGVHRTTDGAHALCAAAPTEFTIFCFESIGQFVPGLHADPAARGDECAKAAEPEWVLACRSSAGLIG